MVANIALAHSPAFREGHIGFDGLCFGGGGHAQIDHADLRAVAMGDDDLVALLNQIDDGLCGFPDQRKLFIRRVSQRVAAQCDDNSFTHCFLPLFYQSGKGRGFAPPLFYQNILRLLSAASRAISVPTGSFT